MNKSDDAGVSMWLFTMIVLLHIIILISLADYMT